MGHLLSSIERVDLILMIIEKAVRFFIWISHLGNVNNQKLFTGDIAYFDKDNFYYIVGRKSNFIKIFGHRIDISYLEDYLSSKGFKLKCSNLDNQVLLNYSIKNLNKELVINLLFKEFNINKNYIKFKYSKYMTYNTKKYL